jgi:putative protease
MEKTKAPELLAPAGSFAAAYHAFQAGADGVYLGLTDFSARRGAVNFTVEQLRRLLGLARPGGKRVYVTVNTVIREAELERLAEALVWLELLAVDGVFIQDMGVYRLLRRHFPRLPIIASTQMALHSNAGLRVARELGFRRVILPRELPFAEIRSLREADPDIELEVFIHGALCYSYSGLCLASGLLLGRSGNRGECAQLCRAVYREEGQGGAREGSFFSCRDLALEEAVLRLAEIGIDAFKIEGRMKSPEYVFNTVRYYRRLLDTGGELPGEEKRELARRRDLSFSREHTRGYFDSPSGSRLLDAAYPLHRGVPLGMVREVRGALMTLDAPWPLSLRDGLAWFPPDAPGDPVIFPILKLLKGGRELRFCAAGERVQVELPRDGRRRPEVGQQIYQLSSRFLDLPQPREASFKPWRIPLAGRISVASGDTPGGDTPGGDTPGPAPARRAELRVETELLGRPIAFAAPITIGAARGAKPFGAVLSALFRESGTSPFVLEARQLENRPGLAGGALFGPPSELKRAKNAFYASLERLFQEALASRLVQVLEEPLREPTAEKAPGQLQPPLPEPAPLPPAGFPAGPEELAWVSCRERPCAAPAGRVREPAVPFVTPREGLDPQTLPRAGALQLLPLPPVLPDEELRLAGLERWLARYPDRQFAIGVNNLSHLDLARRLSSMPNVWFFVDFFAYVANHQAFLFYAEKLPRLLFQCFWIEGSEADYRLLSQRPWGSRAGAARGREVPLLRMDSRLKPPLFYSLGCYAKHHLGQRCGPACPRSFRSVLRQGERRFTVLVEECVSYLFRRPGGGSESDSRGSPAAGPL